MKTREHLAIYSDEQAAAIHEPAPFRALIAGAGSGKTHTLTGRILHDIETLGVEPSRCVAITFTNAGAEELKRRISHKLRFVGTLHAYCLTLVNSHGAALGYRPGKVVMVDEKTEEKLIEKTILEANSTKTKTPVSAVRAYKGSQSIAKREGIIARDYCRRLRRANAVDFDTVLIDTLRLISEGHVPALDALYVDEYQDSGPWDSMIYKAIKARLKLVVGDPDQSIYEWRGGRLENLLELVEDPQWKVGFLNDNYRSNPAIVEAANRLIASNSARVEKAMKAQRPLTHEGVIRWDSYSTPQAEAVGIAQDIKSMLADGCAVSEIAVLVRHNAQVKPIAEALAGEDLPVKLREPKAHPWLGVAVSALNTLLDPENVITSSLWEEHAEKERPALCGLTARQKLEALGIQFEPMGKQINGMHLPPDAMHGIRAAWGSGDLLEIIPRLISSERELETTGEGILVSTIHGSKGLEWPVVYLAGMHAKAMPGAKRGRELEAERRLLYVGITRARDVLRISDTKKALRHFETGLDDTEPSPFKSEVFTA